jgi:precorrin-4 methylase
MRKKMPPRSLFHTLGGGIDISRLVEQMIPTVVMGIVVIYANSLVSSAQISTLKDQANRTDSVLSVLQAGLNSTNVETARLNAQVVAFLGQQVALNAAMDARLTYLERARETGSVTVIQPPASSTTIQPRRR